MFINKWLVEHKINFVPQYSHDKIILSSGRRPLFDFAIFDENNNLLCLIEYQGKQHYFSGQGWNYEENHLEIVRRDNEKRNQCSLLGIKLIGTIGKVNTLVDDVTQKVKTLDKVFELVDLATDRVGMIADVTVNFITSGFKKVFGILNKSKKEETIDE